MHKPQRLRREVIYENRWVNLYADRVSFPGGRIIERHHILEFEIEAVATIMENSEGQILLAEVYRYPTDSIDWEIPAGGIELGEAILEASKREILEETGYDSFGHELIYTFYPMNGIANKVFHIARCKAGAKIGEFDENEVRAVRWFDRAALIKAIQKCEIKDGYTLTGLLLHLFDWQPQA